MSCHCFKSFIFSRMPSHQKMARYLFASAAWVFSGTLLAFPGTFSTISVLFDPFCGIFWPFPLSEVSNTFTAWVFPLSDAGSGWDAGGSCWTCAACLSAAWRSASMRSASRQALGVWLPPVQSGGLLSVFPLIGVLPICTKPY